MSVPSRQLTLGIDFGTSYTSAAAYLDGRIELVMDGGDSQIPSVVYIPETGEPLVGRQALLKGITEPAATLSSVKRILGRRHDDPAVKRVDYGVGYKLYEGPGGDALIKVRNQDFSPIQIVASVLRRVRDMAERRYGARISQAVLSVPVGSTPQFIQALGRAAQLAGMSVPMFVPEPVAGMLACGMHAKPDERRVVVADFGGGTFDVSLVQQEGTRFTPVASGGDDFLGGDDLDVELAEAVAGVVYHKTRADLHTDQVLWRLLTWRCEAAKRALTVHAEARLRMKDAFVYRGRRQELNFLVERTWIEPRWDKIVQRAVEVVAATLRRAGWRPEECHEIVLIGGSSVVPIFRRRLNQLFHKDPVVPRQANLAVVTGAALATHSFHKAIKGATGQATASQVS